MGVFERLPYLNYHDINLDWLVKQTKKNASDNKYILNIFHWFQDEGLIGTVTDVTENPDNTVKIDYTDLDTQTSDDFTVYDKQGTDNAISGAITDALKGLSSLPTETDLLDTDLLLINRNNVAKAIAGDVVAKQDDMDTAENNIINLQNNKKNAASVGTNDILASAVSQGDGTLEWYYLGGANYTGTIPDNSYAYANGIALKRSSTSIQVIVFPSSSNKPVIYNMYDGSNWLGWQSITFNTGTMLTGASSTVTVPTATSTEISSMIVTPGTWVVTAQMEWNESFSGLYVLSIVGFTSSKTVRADANAGGGVSITMIENVTANTTLSLRAYQASGSDKNAKPYFKAVKVG